MPDARQVMMIQQGARRNYIYARQLEAAGLLSHLVCDAAWSAEAPDRVVGLAGRVMPRLAGAISRRSVTGIPRSRIRATILPNLVGLSRRFMHEERAFAFLDEVLALPNYLHGLGDTKVVVNYHGNGGSFLSHAKRRGAKIVTDFVITPKYLEIERQEQDRWPLWGGKKTSASVIAFYRKRIAAIVGISDIYLCPSQAVADDLSDLPNFDPSRVRILPYGVSGFLKLQPRPLPGRVLFAGAAGLRKGIPYLAQAAEILAARKLPIEIVIAGAVSPEVRTRPEVQHLKFLGKLDRQQMAEQYSRADVFCLPSLAEGSATSIFEALASGVPVVTTGASGSVVRSGIEGIVVPERDGLAIADAIVKIVQSPDFRMSMSAAAYATAARYGDQFCGQAFIEVIEEVLSSSTGRIR